MLVILDAMKKWWPNSTCVGSPYLAAKSLNYAKRMRPSWKLKGLQQKSTDICIWWRFNPILSGQSTFHLLQFQSCCQESWEKPLPKQETWLGIFDFILAHRLRFMPECASEQQWRWTRPRSHWPAKPPGSERTRDAFHGVPDRRWSCTASLCSRTCRTPEGNITLINGKPVIINRYHRLDLKLQGYNQVSWLDLGTYGCSKYSTQNSKKILCGTHETADIAFH